GVCPECHRPEDDRDPSTSSPRTCSAVATTAKRRSLRSSSPAGAATRAATAADHATTGPTEARNDEGGTRPAHTALPKASIRVPGRGRQGGVPGAATRLLSRWHLAAREKSWSVVTAAVWTLTYPRAARLGCRPGWDR